MSAAPAHDDSLWEKFYRAPLLRREYGQLPESGVFTYTTAHGDTLSSLSLIHIYAFVPFQSLANYRATTRAQTIYSVWRLDGATAAIAEAQVDSCLLYTSRCV